MYLYTFTNRISNTLEFTCRASTEEGARLELERMIDRMSNTRGLVFPAGWSLRLPYHQWALTDVKDLD